jgi:hypothetical protein
MERKNQRKTYHKNEKYKKETKDKKIPQTIKIKKKKEKI